MRLNVGIVGASGIIGKHLITALESKHCNICMFSARKNPTHEFVVKNHKIPTINIHEYQNTILDYIIFATHVDVSMQWIPEFLKQQVNVIDLSDKYRLQENVPLYVADIANANVKNHKLIAIPNCTVSILVSVLFPLHIHFKVDECNVCTYQSVSGAGRNAVEEWRKQKDSKCTACNVFNYPIADNIIPLIGENYGNYGYSTEELSIIYETKKILHADDMKISATCVRVSVERGHGLAVSIKFKKRISIKDIIAELSKCNWICCELKTPKDTENDDKIYVSRLRKDLFCDNLFHFWISADQICAGTVKNILSVLGV